MTRVDRGGRICPQCRLHPFALACLLALPGMAPASGEPAPDQRIVAIGDIHGSLEGFGEILRETGLIDADGNWSGGRATLVQTGDYLDRGPRVREVMDLLMQLQEQAASAGGEVIVLLGNHEQFGLMGVYRDLSPESLEAFLGPRSEKQRARAYRSWRRWQSWRAETRGEAPPTFSEQHEAEWMASHPPGLFEYQAALAPEGRYGRWLRTRPVAVVRGRTLFMHAGLSPTYAELSVQDLNTRHAEAFAALDRARELLRRRDALPSLALFDDLRVVIGEIGARFARDGTLILPGKVLQTVIGSYNAAQWMTEADAPLWFRGYALWTDAELEELAERLLAVHAVDRLVAAHSTLEKATIQARLGGRVFLIDTGMLTEYYGGRPSALEISGERITAFYPGERELLAEPPSVGVAGEGWPQGR